MAVKGRAPLFHRLRRGHRIPNHRHLPGFIQIPERNAACHANNVGHAYSTSVLLLDARCVGPFGQTVLRRLLCFLVQVLQIEDFDNLSEHPSQRLEAYVNLALAFASSMETGRQWGRADAQGQHGINDGNLLRIESQNMKGLVRFSLVKYHVFMQGPLPGYPRTAVGATSVAPKNGADLDAGFFCSDSGLRSDAPLHQPSSWPMDSCLHRCRQNIKKRQIQGRCHRTGGSRHATTRG